MLLILVLLFLLHDNFVLSNDLVKEVILIRHCVRSTSLSNETYHSNVSFPLWNVKPRMCLPKGLEIAQVVGKDFLTRSKNDPLYINDTLLKPFFFNVDIDAQRDIDTTKAILIGLEEYDDFYLNSTKLFHSSDDANRCKELSEYERDEIVKQNIEEYDFDEAEADQLFHELSNVLGTDDILKQKGTKERADKSFDVLTTFLMQFGGGEEVAWGRFGDNATEIGKKFYPLTRILYFLQTVEQRDPRIAAKKYSYMSNKIINWFNNESATGTAFLVGHDDDINGLSSMFGIIENADGLSAPVNGTSPTSFLRFQLRNDSNIYVKHGYVDFVDPTKVTYSKAEFVDNNQSSISLKKLEDRVQNLIDKDCVLLPHEQLSEIMIGSNDTNSTDGLVGLAGKHYYHHHEDQKDDSHDHDDHDDDHHDDHLHDHNDHHDDHHHEDYEDDSHDHDDHDD